MITLQLITPHETGAFKAIRLRALQETPSAFGSTYAREAAFTDDEWARRAAQWASETGAAYLALIRDEVCGIAAGFLDQTDPAVAQLVSMWVAPERRRLGIGRRMADAVIAWAETKHVGALRLQVTSDNAGAIGFYENLGFALTGRGEPHPHLPELRALEMGRALP